MSTVAHPPTPIPERLESARLEIRLARADDAVDLNAAIHESIDALRPWLEWAQEPPSLEATRARIVAVQRSYRAGEDLPLLLFEKQSGRVVGGSGLHEPDWRVPKFEIGYWVRSCFAGRGFVTEAVDAIAGLAFAELEAQRVEIRMSAANERSRRVAERVGFELEGVLRNESRHVDGSLRDSMVWARVATR